MKRAVIFDFGGVLMKTADQSPRHRWDERLGLAHGSVEHVVHGSESWRQAQTGALSVADYWADVARQLGISPADVAQLAEDFFSGDQLDAEMLALVERLRAAGHQVALLSNDSPALRGKLTALGIAALFEPLVISGEIGVMKPDTRSYQAVLDMLRLPAEQTIFVDDMPANIAGAKALGIHGLHYTTTAALLAALEPLLLGE
ncbi:MAG: HAD family phosphatase [Anaerolineae bacterium]|nr:HAD family phosphatase [Anaerolineae bacterium]